MVFSFLREKRKYFTHTEAQMKKCWLNFVPAFFSDHPTIFLSCCTLPYFFFFPRTARTIYGVYVIIMRKPFREETGWGRFMTPLGQPDESEMEREREAFHFLINNTNHSSWVERACPLLTRFYCGTHCHCSHQRKADSPLITFTIIARLYDSYLEKRSTHPMRSKPGSQM